MENTLDYIKGSLGYMKGKKRRICVYVWVKENKKRGGGVGNGFKEGV